MSFGGADPKPFTLEDGAKEATLLAATEPLLD
jgi:hypothetical protein